MDRGLNPRYDMEPTTPTRDRVATAARVVTATARVIIVLVAIGAGALLGAYVAHRTGGYVGGVARV